MRVTFLHSRHAKHGFALLALATMAPARAQLSKDAKAFPSRAAKIVVPFTPGGTADVLPRAIAEELGVTWRQPIVVENKPGAGGNIGAQLVAQSPPDGYYPWS